jgi:hypothetical protein
MKDNKIDEMNFIENAKLAEPNTLNFENHTMYDRYNFEGRNKQVESVLNLCIDDNYIISEIVPYLRKVSKYTTFDDNDRSKYEYKPMALSFAIYHKIDYWWLILVINGYFNARDFHSFDRLMIPTKEEMEGIMDKEIYANPRIGVFPEPIEVT